MNQKKIETQKELDQLIGSIDWHEAFIREFYSVSPSYVVEEQRSYSRSEPATIIRYFRNEPLVQLLFKIVYFFLN